MVDLLSLRITLAIIFIVIFLIVVAVIFLSICLRRRKLLRNGVQSQGRDAKLYGFGNQVYDGEPPSENSFMNDNSDYFGGSGGTGRHYTEISERAAKIRPEYIPVAKTVAQINNLQQPDVIQREMFRRPTDGLASESHFVYDYTYAHQLVPLPITSSSAVFFNNNRSRSQEAQDLHQTVKSFSHSHIVKSANPHTIQTVSLIHEAPPDVGLENELPNTPLARLSPSSGSSSQQTLRILTLQDISRKPIQSTLLESTTTSSGDVSKGVIQSSNSEISWNKPITGAISEWSSAVVAADSSDITSNLKPSSVSDIIDNAIAATSLVDGPASRVDNHSRTSSESDDDSFTCSEFEYENDINIQANKTSFRDSFSTVVTSEDDIASNDNVQPSVSVNTETASYSLDCLLNWGPNFKSLEGVFQDIAQLPDLLHNSSSSSATKSPSIEVYV